jgi:hypothetical protein
MSKSKGTTWASDPESNGSRRAMEEGQYEALAEIATRAEALKSLAFDAPPTPASRKAEGALLVYRAAYAASYREILMVEEWDRSLARGSGLPPDISKHPFERARDHAADVDHEAYMAELDAKYPKRRKGETPPWWENGNALQAAIGCKKPQGNRRLSEEPSLDFIAAKAVQEGWDAAKCAEYGLTEHDVELWRLLQDLGKDDHIKS